MIEDAERPGGSVPSPCVRNCCLDENDICLGCHRSMSEIMRWGEASDEEKREILARCHLRHKQRQDRMAGKP